MKYSVFALLLLAISCKPDKKESAGKGGSATLDIRPQHHTVAKNIINGKVFIRYNTLDAPTSGVYDDSVACTNRDSISIANFSGLKNGSYYLFVTGYDTTVSQNVKGGVPCTISTQSATLSVTVPVSED